MKGPKTQPLGCVLQVTDTSDGMTGGAPETPRRRPEPPWERWRRSYKH